MITSRNIVALLKCDEISTTGDDVSDFIKRLMQMTLPWGIMTMRYTTPNVAESGKNVT
jgi:hypothetical protein